MGYEINADNVVEEYGDVLEFYVNDQNVTVMAFDPVKGEIEMMVKIGDAGFLDAYDDIVTVKFIPMRLKAVYPSSRVVAYERNLQHHPITR